jgi:hypothetical protein
MEGRIMAFGSRIFLLFVFAAFFGGPSTGVAGEPDRTAHRSVLGYYAYPDWFFAKPDHDEFSPRVSNSDPLTQHPHQWDGQDWDPSKWNGEWASENTLRKFFRARIFEKQYLDRNDIPVVELGPAFYKLSDLDQRRTLKLLSDQMAFFAKGYPTVKLVDWHTRDVIGAYTAKGMFLN